MNRFLFLGAMDVPEFQTLANLLFYEIESGAHFFRLCQLDYLLNGKA